MRTSGILMPVFSLPSKYGIGCFSKEAYQFVDFLKESGQKTGRYCPLDRQVMGIPRISLFHLLPEIRISSIWSSLWSSSF